MSDKSIVLITGGNTGLGLEIVKALAGSKHATPYHIYIGSRKVSAAEDAIKEVQKEFPNTKSTFDTVQIDVSDDASINAAVEAIQSKQDRLDVLINNAGAGFDLDLLSNKISTREAWNKAYDINVTGTHITTHSFMPLLIKSPSPRIIFITSGTSTLTGFSEGRLPNFQGSPKGWPKETKFSYQSYQSSKTGMNMMVLNWHRLTLNDDIKVFCVSPGFLVTGLQGAGKERLLAMGAKDPAVGGDRVRTVVEGERDGDAGKIIFEDGIQPW